MGGAFQENSGGCFHVLHVQNQGVAQYEFIFCPVQRDSIHENLSKKISENPSEAYTKLLIKMEECSVVREAKKRYYEKESKVAFSFHSLLKRIFKSYKSPLDKMDEVIAKYKESIDKAKINMGIFYNYSNLDKQAEKIVKTYLNSVLPKNLKKHEDVNNCTIDRDPFHYKKSVLPWQN